MKRWLLRIVLVFVAVCLLCIGAFVFALNYPKLGRITDFQAIEAVTPLSGTNYILGYHQAGEHDLEITLTNDISQTNTHLSTYSRYFTPPAYKLLSHNNQLYLLLQFETGGSASLMWFQIYNLSSDTPYNVIARSDTPDEGLSCTYPRLVGDALEFETAMYCDLYIYEVLTARHRTYRISLT